MIPTHEKLTDKMVLLGRSCGLIIIIGGIILGIFTTPRALPNWAENVLVSIGTAGILKLGDCLNALVQLSTGKSVERLGNQLAASGPVTDPAAPQAVQVVNEPGNPVPVEPAP
jgi:hypothetical protein